MRSLRKAIRPVPAVLRRLRRQAGSIRPANAQEGHGGGDRAPAPRTDRARRECAADDVTAGALFDRQMTVNRLGSQGPLNDDPGVSLAAWLRARFPQRDSKKCLK